MTRLLIAAVSVVFWCAVASAADSPVVTEAKQKVEAGQYKEALQLIGKTLATMPRDADREEQYQLLMLKGESLMRSGSVPMAAGAFDAAAKAASEPKQIAPARATAILIRASQQGRYRPRPSGSEPIDIVDPESRQKAMLAMREDMARQLKPQLDKAMNDKSVVPMIDILPKVMDLGYLEYSAEGSAPLTRTQLEQLGARARELMQSELRRVRQRLLVIDNVSHSFFDGTTRGLRSDERDEVRKDAEYLRQIESTARAARRRAVELGFDGKAWEPIAADAADLADHAQAIIEFVP